MRHANEPGWGDARIFGHISGIMGAVALLSIFSDMVQWRKFILELIGWWETQIKPVLHWMFWWIQEIWPWPWPEWGYDYIVLSILFGFGGVRFFQIFYPLKDRDGFTHLPVASMIGGSNPTPGGRTTRLDVISWPSIRRLVLLFFLTFLTWPICIFLFLLFILIAVVNDGFNRPVRRAIFLALSPIIYFTLLISINYALFFAGVD